MLYNSYSNRSCDFYIFPVFGIGAMNFQNQKQQSHPCYRCYFSSKEVENLFDFVFRKLHNVADVFVPNLCFYCAWFPIENLFKTTLCPRKLQRENHTGVPASASKHEYIVHRRLMCKSKPVYDTIFFTTHEFSRRVFETLTFE